MLLKSRILKYLFPFSPFYFAFAEEGGGSLEDIVDEIDDILEDDDDEGKPDDKVDDDKSTKEKGKKQAKNPELEALKTRYEDLSKNYEELEKTTKKQQEFIDKITGVDDEKAKKAQEAKERQEWDEDAPNKVKALLEKQQKEFDERLTKTEKKQALKDIYSKIEREYDVNLKELSPKIVPLLDDFAPEAIQKNPERILKICLKTLGKLKKRSEDIPFIQSGSGMSSRITGERAKKAEDKIRDRIKKGVGAGNGKSNVFGI